MNLKDASDTDLRMWASLGKKNLREFDRVIEQRTEAGIDLGDLPARRETCRAHTEAVEAERAVRLSA